jgi:hypothetical protein
MDGLDWELENINQNKVEKCQFLIFGFCLIKNVSRGVVWSKIILNRDPFQGK